MANLTPETEPRPAEPDVSTVRALNEQRREVATERHPVVVDWFAWALLAAALVSLALTRVELTDTPWHLATAREAAQSGQWPRVNTFSYTHPDYPVYQQYPAYQSILYAVQTRFGWEGLSVLHLLAWLVIFVLLIAWSGGPRRALAHPWLWALVLVGLQRRMTLRPDLGTFICVLALANGLELYATRPWAAVGLVVVCQWAFANTHQLYPIGLAMLAAYWIELWCRHLWHRPVAPGQTSSFGFGSPQPLGPMTVALLGATLACLGTPLGLQIVKGPAHTLGSLSHHREHVVEFARIWSSPYDLVLACVVLGLAAWGLYRRRAQLPVFELLFCALGTVLAANAVRGVPFLVIAGLGSFGRSLAAARAGRRSDALAPRHVLGAAAACLIAAIVVNERWVVGARGLGGSQFGLGRTLGAWPDHAVAFIRAHPPVGPVMNLTWYTGNALIWELFPRVKVFVDPRFEAYPRQFLLNAITGVDQPAVLDTIVATHRPGWFFLDTVVPGTHDLAKRLVDSGRWALVFADTTTFVIVSVEQNSVLARQFRVDLARHTPPDIDSHPDIAALQWIRWAGLLRRFDEHEAERAALEQARSVGGSIDAVRRSLEAYPLAIP